MTIEPCDASKPEALLVAEYFDRLNSWLGAYFGGLQSTENWEWFYVHLVRIVVGIANAGNSAEDSEIDMNQVIMPKVNDPFQACRLMYQAIGRLRNAVSDGQHRMAAIVQILSGWTIKIESSKIPPKAFVRGGEQSALVAVMSDNPTDDMEARNYFTTILNKLAGRVMVRILRPGTSELDFKGEEYSFVREVSQSKHKARVTVDV